MSITLTKNEFIEILDERLDKKLDEKLDKKLDEKFNEFAVIVNKSFQRIEDKMATKEELKVLEVTMDKRFAAVDRRFNSLDRKIDNYKGNTDRRIDWLTGEVIKLKSVNE